MKVLIIHHLETIWESAYLKFGEDFESLCYCFIEHLEENEYDKIILTQFENWEAQPEHDYTGISYYVTDWYEYGYGWDMDSIDGCPYVEGKDYCEGGNHSDIVMLDDWMWELKGDEVYISGAFDGECIEDLEYALQGCGIDYTRIEELIL